MNIKLIIKSLKKFINADLILILSLGYLGLLFAGRGDLMTWIYLTIALVSANFAHISFRKLQEEKSNKPGYKDLFVPKGGWKNTEYWPYGLVSSIILIFISFMINDICYYLSIILVILLLGFPLLRRLKSVPNYNLGIFAALCPIGGFLAANNRFEVIPFILAASIIFWTIGLEIGGSIFNINTIRNKKNILTTRLGASKSRIISKMLYLFSLVMLIIAGIVSERGLAYWITLFCYAMILVRQQYLLSSKDVETARNEFLQVNKFIAPLLFAGTLIDVFYK